MGFVSSIYLLREYLEDMELTLSKSRYLVGIYGFGIVRRTRLMVTIRDQQNIAEITACMISVEHHHSSSLPTLV